MSQKNNSIVDINDLKSFFRLAAKNWYIPVIFLTISAAISFLYTYKLTDIYSAQTQILLKSNETYDYQNKIYQNLGYSNYQGYFDNSSEIRVLKSWDLIEQAVDKLNLDVSYFIVGRLKTTEIFDMMPYKVTVKSLNPGLYNLPIKFKILSTSEYSLEFERNGQGYLGKFKFDEEAIDNEFRLHVKKSNSINKETIDNLKNIEYLIQFQNKNHLVARFQNSLSVEVPEYTNILQVNVKDPLPDRAVAFLDTLSAVYIENSVKSNYKINENTLYFIDKQINEVTEILSTIEDSMQDFRQKESILDLTREGDDYFKKLSEYETNKSRVVLNIGAIDALEKYIIEGKDPEFLPPSVYVNSDDEFLKRSVSELYGLQITRNNTLFKATESSPPIMELDEKIDRLKKNLLTYISNSRIAMHSKIKDIDKQIFEYVANIKTLPGKQRDLLSIQRRLQVNEKMYLFLLEKRANTMIAKAGILPEAKVIEKAKSLGITEPNRGKIRGYFLLGGLLISFLVIFVRTVFFEKIESIEELKQKTNLPILGEILQSKTFDSQFVLTVEQDPKSAITESFRTIRTNLQFFASSKNSKVVLITSHGPGEGKTFCSLNLASILAKAGKRVLLLELDLHKPKVHVGLGMKSDIGISSVLIGQLTPGEAIIKTFVENLDVMLSGPLPPNASELILNERLNQLFDYGKEHYDYVIIDTPPVGLITDAVYMMGLADVSLFVLNANHANSNVIATAHDILENNSFSNFAFILNGVKRNRSRYYYNRYSYGYGYGYGYGGYGYSNTGKEGEMLKNGVPLNKKEKTNA